MLKIYDGPIEKASEKSFTLSEELFCEVQAYVSEHNIAEGTSFPVLDQKGKTLFWLIYLEDLIAGIRRKDLSDYRERFQGDVKNLDFTFLDQYQKFIFLHVDGYSIALAKLLQRHRPDKKVIFCDKRAKYFVKGKGARYPFYLHRAGRYMELTEEWMRGVGGSFQDRIRAFVGWKILGMLKNKKKCCIVKADRRNHPDEEGVVYNSQNVVYSLLWKRTEKSFGDKNGEKNVIILDYPCDNEGLGSITKCAFAHVMWMTREGYIPVMHLHSFPNQYLNDTKENMWEYFFEPVSDVSTEDAYQSKHVIIATENDVSWCDFHINPYQRRYMGAFANAADFRKIVRINQETKKHIAHKMPKEIRDGKRVLGVVARGTDFRKDAAIKTNKTWRENVVEIDAFIEACDHCKEQLGCDYIFVATEDKDYFERFAAHFGENLLSISQKRVSYDYENLEFKPVKELLAVKDGKMAGRDYLSIIQSLVECKALLYNVECGAVRLALSWKQDSYELFQCVSGR